MAEQGAMIASTSAQNVASRWIEVRLNRQWKKALVWIWYLVLFHHLIRRSLNYWLPEDGTVYEAEGYTWKKCAPVSYAFL